MKAVKPLETPSPLAATINPNPEIESVVVPISSSPVFTPIQATKHLAIATKTPNTDGLKASRSTGVLWGTEAPPFMKCGRKILYRVSDLDDWLSQFQRVTNNAQVENTVKGAA